MYSDKTILQWIKNPTNEAYEIKMCCNELTFFGVSGQPDFARLLITVYPNEYAKYRIIKNFKAKENCISDSISKYYPKFIEVKEK